MQRVTFMMLFQLALHVVASFVPTGDVPKRALIYIGMLVPTAIFYLRRENVGGTRKTDLRSAVRCITLLAPFMLFFGAVIDLATATLTVAVGYVPQGESPALSAYSVLFSVILTPIIEELFVRGAVLGTVKKESDAATAVTVSAILFALMHLDLLAFPYALAAGLFLGVARVLSGSLTVPIVLHAASNLLTILCSEAAEAYGGAVLALYFASLALLCALTLVHRRKALLEVIRDVPLKLSATREVLHPPVLLYVVATLPLFILNI